MSVLILCLFVIGCGNPKDQKVTNKDYKALLDKASTVKIEEAFVSLGKHYDVYVGDEKVAEVTGNFFTTFGDTFIMKDPNGNFLIKETEIKRWGLEFDRMAEVQDQNNNTLGYIGEKTWTKIFSIGYTFHFFNSDKQMIGTSDQINFSFFKENQFFDNNNKVAYQVQKKMGFTDKYELKVYDKSIIPLYQAILMVCIEDSIKDAEDKKNDKKKNN